MSTQPSVIVNKRSGFFTALVQGFFLMVVTALVCVTILGSIGMLVFNQKSSDILAFGTQIINKLENWPAIVPPVVGDMFQTERSIEYRDQLDLKVRQIESPDHTVVVLEVENRGEEVVSWLTAHVVAFDAAGIPLSERSIVIASPFSFDIDDHCEWERVRGLLLPGNIRQVPIDDDWPLDVTVNVELTELRVWREREFAPEAPVVPATPQDSVTIEMPDQVEMPEMPELPEAA
jgi:hypothetical protein